MLTVLVILTVVFVSCKPSDQTGQEGTTVTGKTTTEQPKTTTEQPKTTTVAPGVETMKDALGRTVEKPRYGGTYNVVLQADVMSFDTLNVDQASVWTMRLTNEKLSVGNFTLGPTGKNEVSWQLPGIWSIPHEQGWLAESWEVKGNDTVIFHIRKGVRFHNKPPVNGREMTADDVVYSLKRAFTQGSFLGNSYSVGKTRDVAVIPHDLSPLSIVATDKYTVEVKTPVESLGSLLQNLNVGIRIIAKEMVDQYKDLTDWRAACGTGAYMLTDYVRDSSISFKRNPDYWMEHPLYPGMKMPFPDGARALIIPDISTQTAAIRTGKIDAMRGVLPSEVESLLKSRPDLKTFKFQQFSGPALWFRLDKDLPFKDLKVRRAISMAIDREGIIQGYYKGEAVKFSHPIMNTGELADIFTPLDQLPKTIQENYTYNPDMAKKLLAEAGYPNGFKTKITCSQPQVDVLSIVKENLAKVGIQAELDVKETGVWQTIQRNSTQDEMLMVGITNIYYTTPLAYVSTQIPTYNHSRGVDEYIDRYVNEKITPNNTFKDKELRANLKALVPYLLDLVWVVELPSPMEYTIWQPWVKGYSGEYSVGRGNHGDSALWIWIDKEMKIKVTGQQ
jgi:peptide/nickel transport system substrate-binding protein